MSQGVPLFLVDNLLSIAQYPAVVLAGNEELAGFESFHVADGRRSGNDYWSPITPNNPALLTWSDGRSRSPDMIVLDRGHNLAGITISLQCSNDNATWQTVTTATIPSAMTPGQAIDSPLGVVTEEGAWMQRFTPAAAVYWRLSIPAMGIGLLPNIVGLWVGKSWYPTGPAGSSWLFNLPTSQGRATLQTVEATSEAGWIGRGIIAPRKEGTILLKLTNVWDFDPARYNIESLFGDQGAPCWVAFDDSQAEQAFLMLRPSADQFGFTREQSWYFKQAQIPYVEHAPLRP